MQLNEHFSSSGALLSASEHPEGQEKNLEGPVEKTLNPRRKEKDLDTGKVGEQERVKHGAPGAFSLYSPCAAASKSAKTATHRNTAAVCTFVLSRAARAKTSSTVSCSASKYLPCNGHRPPHDPPVMPS